MTALRNACSATDTVLDIDTALDIDIYPKPYTIESEAVDVLGGGHATSITVRRGVGGTTAASHVNGTALTAANAFGGGGGGGFTVLGPYEVAFDTVPDLDGDHYRQFYFGEIPDQWILYDVMMFTRVAWAGADAESIEILIGYYNDTDDTSDYVKRYGGGYAGTSVEMGPTPGDFWWEQNRSHTFGTLGTPPNSPVAYLLGAVAWQGEPFTNRLMVEIAWAGNTPTAGSALVVGLLLPPIPGLVP